MNRKETMANNLFIELLPPWVETGLQPAFYDKESGSVLQQTARMYAKVNETVAGVDHLNDVVDDYIERFNDLHDYVYEYFDTLDVQEEIDNKLDKMIDDGSFQPLLNITFTTYYNQLKTYTDNALDNKVDKDGIGQVTFNNLSQSVKEMFTGGNTPVVGVNSVGTDNIIDNTVSYQKLNENGKNGVAGFNQRKTLSMSWEQGTRHASADGSLTESSNTIVTTTTFKVSSGMRIKCNPGYKAHVYSYNSGTRWWFVNGFTEMDQIIGNAFPVAHINDDFYISIRHTDDTDLTPSEGPDSIVITENQTNVKSSYDSFTTDAQKMFLGNTTTIKLTDTFSFANPIDPNYLGFRYYNGPTSNNTNNRGILNTPIYLPTGTTLASDNGWEFVIVTASSATTEDKTFYPQGQGWVDSYTVQYDDIYYIAFRNSDNTSIGANAQEFITHFTLQIPTNNSGMKTIYVSGAGDDTTGDGSYSNPYREINKAINEGGNIIICEPNYKYEPVTMVNKSSIKIIGNIPTYSTANKVQQKPYFDNSIVLTGNTLENNKIKIPYIAEENSDMYECLVSKTKAIKDSTSTRSDGYYCTIFSEGDKDTSHRYIPVTTQDDVEGHFFYDGSYIYINPYSDNTVETTFELVDAELVDTPILMSLNRCHDIEIVNFTFKHSNGGLFYAQKCTGIKLINTDFCGSSQSDNMAVVDTNVELNQCTSYLARNDGFNFHGFGESTIIKCIGANCFDDGMSHHDKSNHTVIGGEYYGNNKGGIASPTYGCSSDIHECYIHNNTTGIHTGSDTAHGTSYINLSNNLIVENNTGVKLNQCEGVVFNNIVKNNNTNIVNNSSVVVY